MTASYATPVALAGILLAAHAVCCSAQAVTSRKRSVMTAAGPADCTPQPSRTGHEIMRCPGVGGWRVVLEESAGRTYITLESETGPTGPPPAPRTFEASNHVIAADRQRAMIEWRVSRPDGAPEPYATIVRYMTSKGGRQGEVLVVSKVAAAGSCQVAYIDALANRNPIVIAREIADRRARMHDCARPPTVEGLTGKSPM